MVKNRILALDVGDKRIGMAVSDPMGFTAQGLTTLLRKSFPEDCRKIAAVMEAYAVEKIIIGLPLDLEGKEGRQAEKVKAFAEAFKKFLERNDYKASIEFWDESFTSEEAEAVLLEANLGRSKRKKLKDKLAAALMLQRYLYQG